MRLQKFISNIDTTYDYDIEYTGTPPNQQFFRMEGVFTNPSYSIIKIKYPNAGLFRVHTPGGSKIAPKVPNAYTGALPELNTGICGSNRYIQDEQVLEFVMRNDCKVVVKAKDAGVGRVRLAWPVEECFQNSNINSFINTLASTLNIDSTRIKVAGVKSGSTILMFSIESEVES